MSHTSKNSAWIRAVSEFFVIVIGVIVALMVDQWASDRSDRASEVEYLRALAVDLRFDSTALAADLIPLMAQAESTLAVIRPIARGSVPLPADTIALLRQMSSSAVGFADLGVRSTFDELLATGALRLIESAELRSAVVSYYERKRLFGNRADERSSGYNSLVRAYLPEEWLVSEASLRAFGMQDAIELLRTTEFARAMNRQSNYLGLVPRLLELLLSDVTVLIADLDRELERLR